MLLERVSQRERSTCRPDSKPWRCPAHRPHPGRRILTSETHWVFLLWMLFTQNCAVSTLSCLVSFAQYNACGIFFNVISWAHIHLIAFSFSEHITVYFSILFFMAFDFFPGSIHFYDWCYPSNVCFCGTRACHLGYLPKKETAACRSCACPPSDTVSPQVSTKTPKTVTSTPLPLLRCMHLGS